MRSRRTTGRTATGPMRAVGTLAVIGALLLAGCTSGTGPEATGSPDDPRTQTPDTPRPVPTHTLSPREQNIADAREAFLNYNQVSDAVAQDYFHGWEEKILPLTSGDEAVYVREFYGQAEAGGYRQVGEIFVHDLRLADGGYQEDPTGNGLDRLEFTACVDYSQVQVLAPDGRDTNASPGRYPASVTMQHLPAMDEQGNVLPDQPGRWAVDTGSVNFEGAQC